MQTISAKTAAEGFAAGRILIYRPARYPSREREGLTAAGTGPAADRVTDPAAELARFESARMVVRAERIALAERASSEAGRESTGIFEAHAMLLEDEDLIGPCRKMIADSRCTAEEAAAAVFEAAADRIAASGDEDLRARSLDIRDLGHALTDILSGRIRDSGRLLAEPYILAAEDLTPSELMRLDRPCLRGVVLPAGSRGSHTVVLARGMGIPLLIGCGEISDSWNGREAVLDASDGILYIDPDEGVREHVRALADRTRKAQSALSALKDRESVTVDGRHVRIMANIGGLSDIDGVLACGADGVGLLRTEFLYLNRESAPSEEEQYRAYRRILEAVSPRPVIIRTFDLGADKAVPYLQVGAETNPALGCRGIRLSLLHADIFRVQLRALLRASAHGRLGIMFPMIVSAEEVRTCRALLSSCRQSLAEEGIPVADRIVTGIMVETPAAVLCADTLAAESDFFSLGTNDLTQYILAADRQSETSGQVWDPRHPAVLEAVRVTAEAGHRHGIPVGICGELAADTQMTETLLRMGVDSLSAAPSGVLALRGQVRHIDLSKPPQGA